MTNYLYSLANEFLICEDYDDDTFLMKKDLMSQVVGKCSFMMDPSISRKRRYNTYNWYSAVISLNISSLPPNLLDYTTLIRLFNYSDIWDPTKSITEQFNGDSKVHKEYIKLLEELRASVDDLIIHRSDDDDDSIGNFYSTLDECFKDFLQVLNSINFENPGYIDKYFPEYAEQLSSQKNFFSPKNSTFCYKQQSFKNRYIKGVNRKKIEEFIKYLNVDNVNITVSNEKKREYFRHADYFDTKDDLIPISGKIFDKKVNIILMYDEIFVAWFSEIYSNIDSYKSEDLINFLIDLKNELVIPEGITVEDMSNVISAIRKERGAAKKDSEMFKNTEWVDAVNETNIVDSFFDNIDSIKNTCLHENIVHYPPRIIKNIYTAIL